MLRQLRPPHRILTILEGESLLNDASALLIYRLAVGAVAAGGFSLGAVAPTFLLAVVGSLVAGPALGWLALQAAGSRASTCRRRSSCSSSAPSACGCSPSSIGLSGVLTMVCLRDDVARTAPARTPARMRIPTYAVWETVVFALNILAFIFIGLQIRPILDEPRAGRRAGGTSLVAGAVLVTVIVVRIAWHMSFNAVIRWRDRRVRLPSAAADAAADGRQRPGHLVGRHARHRLAGGGAGAASGVSVSRPDRADRVSRRARHAGDPGA